MKQRTRVIDLASELGVSSLDVVQAAKALGINVNRAVASLSPGQEYRIRDWHAKGNMRRRVSRAVAPAPAKAPEPSEKTAKCVCCHFFFLFRPLAESHQLCPDCRSHFEESGESYVRTLQRHEDHVKQARHKVDAYRRSSERLATERDEAYGKRDKWMAALVEVVVAHAPDEETSGCVCGASEFPCVTRRHLRHVNRGIFERCEELEQLNEADFDKILYGRDFTFFKDWDAGVA